MQIHKESLIGNGLLAFLL